MMTFDDDVTAIQNNKYFPISIIYTVQFSGGDNDREFSRFNAVSKILWGPIFTLAHLMAKFHLEYKLQSCH